MSEEQREERRKGAHFTFNGTNDNHLKNTPLNFNTDSMKSIPQEKKMSHSKLNIANNVLLPINLFHSPGEYNKMIIKCVNPHKESYLEKQMGIVKTLQFINQPIFQQEKQKRIERLKYYEEELARQKQEKKEKEIQKQMSCICCCCDDYCKDCVKTTSCQIPQEKIQHHKQQFQKQMQRIKIKISQKQKKQQLALSMSRDSSQAFNNAKKSKNNNFNIQMLVNQTLFRQIQSKREKMLEKLQQQEKLKSKQQFNETVRKINKQRAQSAQPKRQVCKEPTKQQIRQAYWNQIKELVAKQIKKDKIQQSKIIEKKDQKNKFEQKAQPTASEIAINRIIVKRAEEALKQMRWEKEKKAKISKIKTKKLLALAAQQAEIIKKNRSKKFKPSKEMLQNAFKLIE